LQSRIPQILEPLLLLAPHVECENGTDDRTRATLPAEGNAARRDYFPRLFGGGIPDAALCLLALRLL
jgi:hypothetical protein